MQVYTAKHCCLLLCPRGRFYFKRINLNCFIKLQHVFKKNFLKIHCARTSVFIKNCIEQTSCFKSYGVVPPSGGDTEISANCHCKYCKYNQHTSSAPCPCMLDLCHQPMTKQWVKERLDCEWGGLCGGPSRHRYLTEEQLAPP